MRLIDADILKEQFKDRSLEDFTHLHFIDAIDDAPTVTINTNDIEYKAYCKGLEDGKKMSRPKAEWIDLGDAMEEYNEWGKCSICGHGMFQSDFCPNCGAEMREETYNET